jgi:tetratricopeptide (TPR) repeat protein
MYECLIQLGYERNDLPMVVHNYYHAAIALRKHGLANVATVYFARAREVLLHNPQLYMPIAVKIDMHLARMYLLEGRFAEAANLYDEILQLHAIYGGVDHGRVYHGLACACLCMHNFDRAIEYCDRSIEEYLQNGNTYSLIQCFINKGMALRYAQRYEEAHAVLRSTLANIAPLDSLQRIAVQHELALVSLAMGNYREAMEQADEALKHTKLERSVEASLKLVRAKCRLAFGDLEDAAQELEWLESNEERLPPALLPDIREAQRQYFMASGRRGDLIRLCQAHARAVLTIQK